MYNGFRLLLGKIIVLYVFGGYGVCLDMYVYVGYIILFNYDFMIVKFIIMV